MSVCREIFCACDLQRFICKLVKVLNVETSLSKLRIVICGSIRNKRISSAQAASL